MPRLLVLIAVCAGMSAPLRAAEPIVIDAVLLKLVEQVDVPAEQAGVLREIRVKAGDVVQPGDRLAQIDDEATRTAADRARVDLQMAERLARDRLAVEIAVKSAEQARQKLGELKLHEQIAARQAANIFRVEAAEKAQALAENELSRAQRAKLRFDDAVSQSEIDARRLEAEKSLLEASQSRFEHQVDGLRLDVSREALRGQELAVGAADLQTAQAEAEHEVAQLQAQLKRHDLELARLQLERRRILSPLDGVVVEIYRQPGEWVEPGDPVLRILRLNRLWVEGFIRVEDLSRCVQQARVRVSIPLTGDDTIDVEGQVVYLGREVDPVNREVLVRAEIPNEDFRLLPGMSGQMQVIAAPPAVRAVVDADPAPKPLEERLNTLITADFSLPFQAIVAEIGRQSEIAFDIDREAFKEAGFTLNMVQRLQLGRVTTRQSLQALLEGPQPVIPEKRLCLVLDEPRQVLLITTEAVAKRTGRPIYPLRPPAERL